MASKASTPHPEITKIFSSIARSNRISEFRFDELGPIFITRKDPEAGDWVIRDEFGYVFNRKTMEWERERHGAQLMMRRISSGRICMSMKHSASSRVVRSSSIRMEKSNGIGL